MKKRVKNNILKGSIITAVVGIMISASCFDGDSIKIPIIINAACALWLWFMYIANK